MQMNDEQLLAVTHAEGCALIVAGPGSGKTAVVTERIFWLIHDHKVRPENILVITFSRQAAFEMERRFIMRSDKAYPVNFGTFHSIFYGILRQYQRYDPDSVIGMSDKRRYIEEIGLNNGLADAASYRWQDEMLTKISSYKNKGSRAFDEDQAFLTMDRTGREEFELVMREYEKKCTANARIDYDDMITRCHDLLVKYPKILNVWRQRYRYILVDEFQDINESQYAILKLLAGKSANIFAVGDDDQSIYSFRGAGPGIMKRFIQEYPDCRKIILRYNYRCKRTIVESASRLISHNADRIEKPVQSVMQQKNSDIPGEVITDIFDDSAREAEFVAKTIGELVSENGYGYADICILYRSSHCAVMTEESLSKKGIPYFKRDGIKDIYDRGEMAVICKYMETALHGGNRADYLEILNRPVRNISREALADLSEGEKRPWERLLLYYRNEPDMRSVILKLRDDLNFICLQPPYAAVNYLLYGVGLYGLFKESYAHDPYQGLEYDDFIEEIYDRASVHATIAEWLDAIDKSENKGNVDNSGRVVMQTAHASKGLEYPVVFIIGMQEGLFPHRKSLFGSELEEERRLMYVAMTRAEDRLYICARGQEHGKLPSRFISELSER